MYTHMYLTCSCSNIVHNMIHVFHSSGRGSPLAPPSSGSSGFSDDDSLHYDDGRGLTLEEFVRYLRDKGRQGLYHDYTQIKSRPPEGTFENSRYRTNALVALPLSNHIYYLFISNSLIHVSNEHYSTPSSNLHHTHLHHYRTFLSYLFPFRLLHLQVHTHRPKHISPFLPFNCSHYPRSLPSMCLYALPHPRRHL